MRIKNDEDDATIRLKDNIQFSTDDSTFYTMWHAGNDGSGSGLDADLLDGVQASSFVRSDADDTMSEKLTFTQHGQTEFLRTPGNVTMHSVGSGDNQLILRNLAELRFQDAADWNYNEWAGIKFVTSTDTMYIGGAASSNFTNNGGAANIDVNFVGLNGNGLKKDGNTVFHAGNDGSGSGLDADTLDGSHSTSFINTSSATQLKAGSLRLGGSTYNLAISFSGVSAANTIGHTASNSEGIFWHTHQTNYAIYRTAGAWDSPNYQQLRIDWPTGIILDGGDQYGKSGVRMDSNFLPVTDSTYDIGASALRFANGYFDTLYGSGANLTALNASNLGSGTVPAARIGSATVPSPTSSISIMGNFGQWQAHNTYQDFNADVAYWGWNFMNSNNNAPTSASGQWYRSRLSLGTGYGIGTASNNYWLEMTIPRYNHTTAGQMYIRSCENGSIGSWTEVGSRPRTHVIPYANNTIDLGSSSIRWRNIYSQELNVTKASGNLSGTFTASNGLGTLEIGGSTGAFIDLKMPTSDDFDFRLGTSGSGGYMNVPSGQAISVTGHFNPAANNSYDLGTTSARWRNVYTNDLNLSNEGGANDVDGTWGNFTIQEGEDDLFLINKRNGKKYKFNLTEVS
jgi:hypothetical protein